MEGRTRTVILGAGYAGLRAALELDRLLGVRHPGKEITLINKHNYHQFITRLHESAARGDTGYEDVRIPLAEILGGRDIRLVKDTVTRLDRNRRQVETEGGAHGYDYLVVSLGSLPEFFDIPGLKEHALTLRSLNTARMVRTHIEGMFARFKNVGDPGERNGLLTFVIGGAGLTGVEVAGELADWVPELCRRYDVDPLEVRIINVEASEDILPGFAPDLVEYARNLLGEKGVRFVTGTRIARVKDTEVRLGSGEVIPTQTVIWAGGIRGNPLMAEAGLTVQGRGRAVVNEYLQSVDDPRIYVTGDSAFTVDPESGRPLAPNAQLAIAQGKVAAYNIYADMKGLPKKRFRPQSVGVLASLGPGKGIGMIKTVRAKGLTAALAKEMVPMRYLYSLGGIKLLAKKML